MASRKQNPWARIDIMARKAMLDDRCLSVACHEAAWVRSGLQRVHDFILAEAFGFSGTVPIPVGSKQA